MARADDFGPIARQLSLLRNTDSKGVLPDGFEDSSMHGTTPSVAAEEAPCPSDDEHSDRARTPDEIEDVKDAVDDADIPDSHWTNAYMEEFAPEHWTMNNP